MPNLVAPQQLTTANSLGLAATYGTFPLAGVISALLFKVAEWLGRHYGSLDFLRIDRELTAALYGNLRKAFEHNEEKVSIA